MTLKNTNKTRSHHYDNLRQGCVGFSSFLPPASLAVKKAEAMAKPETARPAPITKKLKETGN